MLNVLSVKATVRNGIFSCYRNVELLERLYFNWDAINQLFAFYCRAVSDKGPRERQPQVLATCPPVRKTNASVSVGSAAGGAPAVNGNSRHMTTAQARMPRSLDTARIVVIGSGPAGIAAATKLLSFGARNLIILEAQDRIGGRIYTVPFADNVVDLGAQWCHGERNNVVYETVKDLDLLESNGDIYKDYKCVRSNGEVLADEVANKLKHIAEESIDARQDGLQGYEGSLGAYLTDYYWREVKREGGIDPAVAKEFFENLKKFESSVEASDNVHEVSGKGHLDYWICEGELLLTWKDKGYHTFLKILMETANGKCPEPYGVLNKRVFLNKQVQHIDWSNPQNVLIKCRNGEIYQADHVICTTSLGVLKENYKEMFHPGLPSDKIRAIEGLQLGTVNKFFIEFCEPFEPQQWSGISFLWQEEELVKLRETDKFWLEGVFGFYRVCYQPRVLAGWIVGPQGRHMETLTEDEVLGGLTWLFEKFLRKPMQPVKSFKRTQWHSNPSFRGSYTFRSLYTEELRSEAGDLARPLKDKEGDVPVLMFAGEATHAHYYSTVHGAVESGFREATRINDYYTAKRAHL